MTHLTWPDRVPFTSNLVPIINEFDTPGLAPNHIKGFNRGLQACYDCALPEHSTEVPRTWQLIGLPLGTVDTVLPFLFPYVVGGGMGAVSMLLHGQDAVVCPVTAYSSTPSLFSVP